MKDNKANSSMILSMLSPFVESTKQSHKMTAQYSHLPKGMLTYFGWRHTEHCMHKYYNLVDKRLSTSHVTNWRRGCEVFRDRCVSETEGKQEQGPPH